jgi:hypothetical protein
MAGAAVVLLTPDDLVRLRSDLLHEDDDNSERELQGQARPNVYYEAGFADALGRERTVIVEMGRVKSFTDSAGRHVVRYDGSPARRHVLAERLRLAGLQVDTSAQDWLTAGDVDAVLGAMREAAEVEADQVSAQQLINKEDAKRRIEEVLGFYASVRARSEFDDLYDQNEDALQFVFRGHALLEQIGLANAYAAEASRVANQPVTTRVPVVLAALRALHHDMLE